MHVEAFLFPLFLLMVQQHSPAPTALELNRAGVLKMNQHLYKEAAALFRGAVAADPDFDLARTNLGIALLYDLAPDSAIPVFREALSRDDRNTAAHFCLGLLMKGKGEGAEALEQFQRVAELDPNCASAHYNLGLLYARRRQIEPAERALRRCLELDPAHVPALYNLGMLLNQGGHAAEGKILLERFRSARRNLQPSSGMGGGGMEYGEMGKYAVARDTN